MDGLAWHELDEQRQRELNSWLNSHRPRDYDAVYSLYHAIADERDLGSYVCYRVSEGLLIKSVIGKSDMPTPIDPSQAPKADNLILTYEERHALLKRIQKRFCEGMDVESFYLFHRAQSIRSD